MILKSTKTILPNREAMDISLVISDGLIQRIEPGGFAVESEFDLSDCVLFPGFIDVHNHGAVGVDVMDAAASDLVEVSRYLSSQGVTGWLPTTVPAADENYAQVAQAIGHSMREHGGARVLGIHYEGPFVNTLQCGALHTQCFKTYSTPGDLNFLKTPVTGPRMITLAPEVEGGLELVAELNRLNWVVSIGHTRADLKLLDAAFVNGARHMTHFMNAMAPLHHRTPGPVNWGLARDDVSCDIIADGIHLDVSVLKLLLKIKGANQLALISDAIAASGKGDGDYQIWGETITVKNGRTSNAAGSIAGSVISMLDAVRLMRSLGVSDVEVAQMASTNPARLLRIDNECGSIAVGKRADLVEIDGAGNVRLTIVGGEVVYSQ
jgi:N-acetylglucosamine-6-phosphate deacetylase